MLLILFKDLHYFYHISTAVLNQAIKIIRMIIKAFFGLTPKSPLATCSSIFSEGSYR